MTHMVRENGEERSEWVGGGNWVIEWWCRVRRGAKYRPQGITIVCVQ